MQTKALTEGAMLSAITVLFVYLGVHVGFVGLIIPVPLALLVLRHGFQVGIIVALVSALVSALALSEVLLALELIIIGLLGIALGMALREKFSISQTLLVGVVAAIISNIFRIVAYSVITGMNMLTMYTQMWDTTSDQWLSLWERMNVSPEMIAEYQAVLEAIPTMLQVMFPALLIGISVVTTWVNLVVLRMILKRLGHKIPWFPPFIYWRFPWYFVLGFILARVFGIIEAFSPNEFLMMVGANLDLIFLYTFLIQGLAIVWFYFDKYRIHKVFRVVFVIFMFQPGPLVLIISLAGILDTWFDFRRLKNGIDKDVEGEK